MRNKKRIKRAIFGMIVLCLIMVSVFSSIYAMDYTYSETNNETLASDMDQKSEISEESESADKVTMNLKIIGNGYLEILDSEGNIELLDETNALDSWSGVYELGEKLNVKAKVKDENSFIYGFYVKYGSDSMQTENIKGKGFSHEVNIEMYENVDILVVFAKTDEKEVVFENSLASVNEMGVQPLVLGNIGQNWGMYTLFTEYTVIPEFGSRSAYLYGHIIQEDTNYDYVYEDATYTAYCIDYNAPCPAGGYLTQSDLSITQKKNIGHAMAYGWRQTETDYNEDLYYDTYARSEIAVTQGIIYCFIENIFNTPSGENAMTTMINATHLPEHARTYYETLKNTILNVDTKPSFNGQTLTLEWNSNQKRYETTVTDTHGILTQFDYVYKGIGFEKNGNKLTVYTTNEYDKGVAVQGKRVVYGGADSVVAWDGWNGNQDMVTYKDNSYEIISSLTIKTKKQNGNLSLNKKSAAPEITNGNTYYSLKGAVYKVYSDKACSQSVGTLTTSSSGVSEKLSLPEGSYYVKESKASKGYLLDANVYTISVESGKDTVLNVKEKPVKGKIILTKTIHAGDINFDNGNPMFTFKLTGDCPDGSIRTYYRIVDFNKDYVQSHTDSKGDVHLSVTFDNLTAGMYTAKELPTSRYVLEKIMNIENGTIDGACVTFPITPETSMQGSAKFINDNYEQQNYSDSAKVINELKK